MVSDVLDMAILKKRYALSNGQVKAMDSFVPKSLIGFSLPISLIKQLSLDPYIDTDFHYSEELPGVTYEQIYDYLVNNFNSLDINQSAFKSLDAYRTVCIEGWLSSLQLSKEMEKSYNCKRRC